MADLTPATWLGATYSFADGKLRFDLTGYPELTAGEVNPTSGDIRKLLFGLLEGIYQQYRTANQALPTAQRPQRTRVSKTVSEDENTGVVTRTYSFRFDLNPPSAGAFEVRPELTTDV